MAKGFEPWIAVKVGVRKNRKLAGLPDDTARYGWIAGVLAEAKLQRPGGRFDSRGQLEEAIGRFAGYVDNYLGAGLLEVSGRLCSACRKVWTALPAGVYVVHDWRAHQRDPFSAARAEAWRIEHENDDGTTDERPANDDGTIPERATNTVDSRDVTADSRARGVTQDSRQRQENESVPSDEVYPAADAEGPLLSRRELTAWAPYRRKAWDQFKAAWRARGFKLPPQGDPDEDGTQAHVVWEILDNRGDELAAWVTEAPGRTSHDVVHHLIERWTAIKAGVEEDDEPARPERNGSSGLESTGEILGRLARPDWLGSEPEKQQPEPVEAKR